MHIFAGLHRHAGWLACALILLACSTASTAAAATHAAPTRLLTDEYLPPLVSPAAAAADPLIVHTECGAAQAAWVDVPAVNVSGASYVPPTRVAVWHSIPYAAPPIGSLRWAAPAKPTCWSGTFDATAFRHYCVQPTGLGSEDCLELSVYVPEELARNNAAQRQQQQQRHSHRHSSSRRSSSRPAARGAPVWFYIHGGGLTEGSGIWEPLAPFAAHARSEGGEPVIVVSINYRLSIFGWLALDALRQTTPAEEPAANFGLLDQQAALQWVQRNIAAFGGDPTRVTLGGQSSGGTSIFALYSSVASRGLFAGGIALSGSINISMSVEQGYAQNAGIPAAAGCAGDLLATPSSIMACMRSASVPTLLHAIPPCWYTPGIMGLDGLEPRGRGYCGLPLVDGLSIQLAFGDALAQGLVDAPLILGNTGQEADLAPDVDMGSWSDSEWMSYLVQALSPWGSSTLAQGLYGAYARMDNGTAAPPEYAMTSLITDYGLTCGTVQLAQAAKAAGGRFKSPLYTYVSQWSLSNPVWLGTRFAQYAFHTSDYTTGIESWPWGVAPAAVDVEYSRMLQRTWATFMATGSLKSVSGIDWRTVDDVDGFPQHYNTFVMRPNHQSVTVVAYKADVCGVLAHNGFDDRFWWCD